MDLPLNADVQCTDGPGGRSTVLILNPVTQRITHLVVHESGLLGVDRMAPVELVTESTPSLIHLRCTKAELTALPPFTEVEYLPMEPGIGSSSMEPGIGSYSPGGMMLWPYVSIDPEFLPVDHERIPPGELVVRRGFQVHAADGHVGRVDEFLIDPANHITHLVLREGHLWGQKNVTIPVAQIDRIEDDAVSLKLTKQEVAALPTLPIRRGKAESI